MSKKRAPAAAAEPVAADAPSVERALARLEEVVRRLEAGTSSLDEALELYAEGKVLHRLVLAKLEETRSRIERIVEAGNGEISCRPLASDRSE